MEHWAELLKQGGVMGAFCGILLAVIFKWLLPKFLDHMERNQQVLSKQADACTEAQREQLRAFTVTIDKHHDLAKTLTGEIAKLTQAVDRLGHGQDRLAIEVREAIKPRPKPKSRPPKRTIP